MTKEQAAEILKKAKEATATRKKNNQPMFQCPKCKAFGMNPVGGRYVCKNRASMMHCGGTLTKEEAEQQEATRGCSFRR